MHPKNCNILTQVAGVARTPVLPLDAVCRRPGLSEDQEVVVAAGSPLLLLLLAIVVVAAAVAAASPEPVDIIVGVVLIAKGD